MLVFFITFESNDLVVLFFIECLLFLLLICKFTNIFLDLLSRWLLVNDTYCMDQELHEILMNSDTEDLVKSHGRTRKTGKIYESVFTDVGQSKHGPSNSENELSVSSHVKYSYGSSSKLEWEKLDFIPRLHKFDKKELRPQNS